MGAAGQERQDRAPKRWYCEGGGGGGVAICTLGFSVAPAPLKGAPQLGSFNRPKKKITLLIGT